VFLAPHMRRVHLLLRGGDLGKNMSSYLVERVQAADNVEVLYHTAIRRMLGDTVLEAVEIENTQTGERRTISTPAVFSFVGAVPRTDWLPAEIETDAKDFIRTGCVVASSSHWTLDREPFLLETSHPGCSPPAMSGSARSSAVLRGLVRAAWRSPLSISTWPIPNICALNLKAISEQATARSKPQEA
jgi:thioredoxin reductase (NADPH)